MLSVLILLAAAVSAASNNVIIRPWSDCMCRGKPCMQRCVTTVAIYGMHLASYVAICIAIVIQCAECIAICIYTSLPHYTGCFIYVETIPNLTDLCRKDFCSFDLNGKYSYSC